MHQKELLLCAKDFHSTSERRSGLTASLNLDGVTDFYPLRRMAGAVGFCRVKFLAAPARM